MTETKDILRSDAFSFSGCHIHTLAAQESTTAIILVCRPQTGHLIKPTNAPHICLASFLKCNAIQTLTHTCLCICYVLRILGLVEA